MTRSAPGLRTNFYETTAEMVVAALKFDADPNVQVFYAPFTFREPTRRTKENAFFACSLWLDIDCGPGKPYDTRDEALEALRGFTLALGWKPSLLVASGPAGVHAYWLLDKALPRDEWLLRARRLKNACEKVGLKADPVRTADPASLLRPVGVRHKKGRPVFVEILS